MKFASAALSLAAALVLCPSPAHSYSVLTHEALIDAVWDTSIKPVLLKKFPAATPEQLVAAHAYCYGGGIIQDVGYYPFGSHLFSDLTHYVRSGGFVLSLLTQASDLNEYAFAIGALAHYDADNNGHPLAINRVVPKLYPKLRHKYGDVVTYVEDPTAHVRTEFGFDVVQVARGRYPSTAYHDFIGFQISKELLERAFEETYGLKLTDVFTALDLALGTYRWSVSSLIPQMTEAAWASRQEEIRGNDPGITRKKFLYNLSRSSYEKDWGKQYRRPGIGARILAFFLRAIPKIGPFKSLGFRTPTPEAELLFEKSFNATIERDKADIAALGSGTLTLPDTDLDTGKPAHQGEYALADAAHTKLFQKLASEKRPIPPALQASYDSFRARP